MSRFGAKLVEDKKSRFGAILVEPITPIEPNVYAGMSPQEVHDKAGQVWDAAADIEVPPLEVETFPSILNDPKSLPPFKQKEVELSTVAPWWNIDIPEESRKPPPTGERPLRFEAAPLDGRGFWKWLWQEQVVGTRLAPLPPDADRIEKVDRAVRSALGVPLRLFLKTAKGLTLNVSDILWAGLKRAVPDEVWDDEVKNMTLDEAMDWAAGYNPSALETMMGEVGEFAGRISTLGPLLGKYKIIDGANRNLTVLEKAAETALVFGASTAVEQVQKFASERIDPTETEYGYEGPSVVLRDMAIGAVFSLVQSGISGAWSKLTPSEHARALKALGLKKGASQAEITTAANNLARQTHPDKVKGLRSEFEKVIAARDTLRTQPQRDIIFRGQKVKFIPKLLEGEKFVAGKVVKPTEIAKKPTEIAVKPPKPAEPTITPVEAKEAVIEGKVGIHEAIQTLRSNQSTEYLGVKSPIFKKQAEVTKALSRKITQLAPQISEADANKVAKDATDWAYNTAEEMVRPDKNQQRLEYDIFLRVLPSLEKLAMKEPLPTGFEAVFHGNDRIGRPIYRVIGPDYTGPIAGTEAGAIQRAYEGGQLGQIAEGEIVDEFGPIIEPLEQIVKRREPARPTLAPAPKAEAKAEGRNVVVHGTEGWAVRDEVATTFKRFPDEKSAKAYASKWNKHWAEVEAERKRIKAIPEPAQKPRTRRKAIDTSIPYFEPKAPKAEAKQIKLPEIARGGVPLEKPAGLSKAEREHLGPREARALIGGQKLGEKIGFKEGERRAALEGKRRLDRLRVKVKMTEKSVDDVYEVIKAYVPGEEQKRFINRLKELSKIKELGRKPLSEKVDKLVGEIHNYIADYEKRASVRRAKKFAADMHKEFNVGEEEFKALPPPVRDALRKWTKTYDLAKLSDVKRGELEAHNEHIISVAGSIASAFERFEAIDVSEGEDIIRLSQSRIDALHRIEETPISDLSTEQIDRVIDELESLIAVNKQKQSSRGRRRFENIQKKILDSRNTVYDRGERKGGAIREHGKIAELGDLYQDSLRTLLGKLAVKDADKLTDAIWEPIARSARAEADVKKQLWVAAEKMIEKLNLTKAHVKQLDKSTEITLGGKKVTVPQWMLLHLYLDTHADGNFHRLLTTKDHYINTKDKLGRTKRFKIGKINLDEIRNIEVPDWTQKLAEVMFKHNRQVAKPLLNEASMSERFYELATAENYFPYPRYWDKPLVGKRTLVTQPIENIGRFQPRTGGTQTHNFFDPIETFYRGIGQNAAYIAHAETMQEIRSILANKALRTKINETGNKKILDAIENILRHVDGLISDQELAAQLGGKWLSNFSKATLTAAPATGVIQIASEPAFFEVIERRFFRNTYIPNKADAETAMEEDPVLWWRWKARQFDYVTGSVSAQKAFEKMVTGKEGINNRLLDILTWGDQKTVMRARQAAKDQITYYNPDMIPGSAEHKQAALELFHRGMETQPQWGAAYRSGITLSKNMGVRPFALFMSARNAQFNLFQRAVDNLHKGRIGVGEFTKRLGNVAEAAARVALLRNLVRQVIGYLIWPALLVLGLRDTDDLKEKVKDDFTFDLSDAGDFAGDVAENIAGVAFLGGVISHMMREAVDAMGGKSDWARAQSLRTGNPIADAVVALGVIAGDLGHLALQIKSGELYIKGHPKVGQLKWHDTAWDLTDKIGLIVSQSMGLPWSGPRRDIVWPMQRSARKVVSKTTQEMQTFTSERSYQHNQRQARIIKLLDTGFIDEAIDVMIEAKEFSILKQIPNRIAKKIAPNLYRWSTWDSQAKLAWVELKGDKFDEFVDEIIKPLKGLDKTIANDPLIKSLTEWSK